MTRQLKKGLTPIPTPKPGFAGREVLAELLSSDPKQKLLEQALEKMGIAAEITGKEVKNLVTVFKMVIEGRERSVAIGHNVADSSDPIGEIQGILRMHGLGVLSK